MLKYAITHKIDPPKPDIYTVVFRIPKRFQSIFDSKTISRRLKSPIYEQAFSEISEIQAEIESQIKKAQPAVNYHGSMSLRTSLDKSSLERIIRDALAEAEIDCADIVIRVKHSQEW